ncbi:hypothetical protein Bca4012_003351 [Brassica carinata]
MNSESEPSEKKKKNLNPSLSLFSLPNDILLNCIARISPSYYPKLSLVSKTFASLISSSKLKDTSLWLKPNQALTNDLEKKEESTGNALLVPIPSSYCRRPPTFMCKVGSECYAINRYCNPSFDLSVTKPGTGIWRKVPKMMTVAREDPIACVLDGKIYVMGGCSQEESKNWGEVYDTKTQTWESLPDPGFYLRVSTLRKMEVMGKKIYVISSKKNTYHIYDTIEGRWEVVAPTFECSVVVDNVSGHIEMANYGGKLLIIWDEFVYNARDRHEKTNIWCALIAFEKRNGDEEVWANVEWASSVLTVPLSCVLLRHVIKAV